MLKIGIIGCGNMGRNHLRVYSELSDVNLVSVADINKDIFINIEEKYGVNFYESYLDMIDNERLDIVSICVPTSFHYQVTKDCIEKRINVLLEKPITDNIKEAEKLLELAENKKVKFLVGHIERFNPAVKKLKEIIDSGKIGNITSIIARRVGIFPPQIQDASVAIDLAIHDIDIINYLLNGLPIEIIQNKKRNLIKNRDDSVEFFLKYKTASAYIQANWITPVKIRKLNITGNKGYIEMDYVNQKIELYESHYEKEKSYSFKDILHFSEPDKTVVSVAKKEPLKEEILYFIDCIRKDKKVDSNFALDSLKIALT